MLNPKDLPPIEDNFEAACYRTILKLIVPSLRTKVLNYWFNWPIDSKRGGADWTACALISKRYTRNSSSVFAYIYGLNHKLIIAFKFVTIELAIADPNVHIQAIKCIKIILDKFNDN